MRIEPIKRCCTLQKIYSVWTREVHFKKKIGELRIFRRTFTVAVYSWSIANNFVIGVYCRCLEILCQIALDSLANYFRSYRKKQFGIKSIGIYIYNKVVGYRISSKIIKQCMYNKLG